MWSNEAQRVLKERYFHKDENGNFIEDVDQMCWRVAHTVAQAEKNYPSGNPDNWETVFHKVILDRDMLPSSPVLMNAGRPNMCMNACFFMDIQDSMDNIFSVLRDSALVMKAGGGVGFAFSSLRPHGTIVSTSQGEAGGPVAFLRAYDAMVESVQEGGRRRGAALGALNIHHPDIMEFIEAKKHGGLKNFNLSVGITDEFMAAVRDGKNYQLRDPRDNRIVKEVSAKDVFSAIAENAWSTGDPGLLFLDTINRGPANPVPSLGPVTGTNPCTSGDTLVATPSGWKRADVIVNGNEIATVIGLGKVQRVEKSVHPVYEVEFNDGARLICTAGHQFHVVGHVGRAFEPTMLKDLSINAAVRVSPVPMPNNPTNPPDGLTEREWGFLVGLALSHNAIILPDIFLVPFRKGLSLSWRRTIEAALLKAGGEKISTSEAVAAKRASGKPFTTPAKYLGVNGYIVDMLQKLKIDEIPLVFQNSNKQFLAGLLDAIFGINGYVNDMIGRSGNCVASISCRTRNIQIARDIRRILLSFGIHATVKPSSDAYPHIIVQGTNVAIFYQEIMLSNEEQANKIAHLVTHHRLAPEQWMTRIKNITALDSRDVYDVFEPVSDTWITEGIVSRGCGEQPLYNNEACALSSINLGHFVKDDAVDWGRLKDVVHISTRFLDNLIDVNYFPLEKIEQAVKANRRIGLGVMGWADMLFKLRIPYASSQAAELAQKLMGVITNEAAAISTDLAKVRGTFPNWEISIYSDNVQYGKVSRPLPLRNAALTTVPPTGTTSILADASSGIEPLFALSMTHRANGRTLHLANSTVREVLTDVGLWSQELADYIEETGSLRGFEGLPEWCYDVFVTAHEITPEWHIKMQAAWQRYCSSSISKTINLPHDSTVDAVKKAYLLAHESGCMGITVYRDGCRDVQVLTAGTKELSKGLDINKVTPRPPVLKGVTYRLESPEGAVFMTLNDDAQGPREVFVTIGKAGTAVNAMAEALGRLISETLSSPSLVSRRERIAAMAEQLENIGGRTVGFGKSKISSVPDAVAKAIRDYWLSEVIHTNSHGDLCPECGEATLRKEEGCEKCVACGYARC